MAEHVIDRGDDLDVRAMAQTMVSAQSEEADTMRSIRADLSGSENPSPMPKDPHIVREMDEMASATGADLDHMFLTEMIVPHAAALPVAHRATPHLKDGTLSAMAAEMYQAQAEEVGEMKRLLDTL